MVITKRRKGYVEFDNDSETVLVVRSGSVKEFEAHLNELIEIYESKVNSIIYASHGRILRGHKKLLFESVGNYHGSAINSDFWFEQIAAHRS